MSNHVFSGSSMHLRMPRFNMDNQRKIFIGLVLLVALLAFEVFNFDTTQFALQSLLGNVQFLGIMWATILAIAFCAIDFAGLMRLFTPEGSSGSHKEGWYLMGAWLLGATMNAVMTWWAVSVTLLGNDFGNEVLSREQLLRYVPIFVAVLVWLTRILFIGAFSIAGAQLFQSAAAHSKKGRQGNGPGSPAAGRSKKVAPSRLKAAPKPVSKSSQTQPYSSSASSTSMPQPSAQSYGTSGSEPTSTPQQRSSRVRQRPPVPNGGLRKPGSLQARRRS